MDRADVLMSDYLDARSDERTFQTIMISTLSIGVATLAALIAVAQSISSHKDIPYPPWVIACMPMVVLAFLAFAEYHGAQASIRSYYMRELARELRAELSKGSGSKLDTHGHMPLLSISIMQSAYSSLRNPRAFGSIMRNMLFGAILAVFGSVAVYLGLQLSWSWRIPMLVFYSVAASVLLFDSYRSSFRGRSFFIDYCQRASSSLADPDWRQPTRTRHPRGLFGYLLLPRPDDLLTKILMTASGLVLGWVTVGFSHIWQGIFIVFGFEYFLYQARYQWNDIRGRTEDQRSPVVNDRRRLPRVKGAEHWSMVVIGFRLLFYVWMMLVIQASLPGHPFPWYLVGAAAALFVIAVAYELVRSWLRRNPEGKAALFLVFPLVCAGYPLRFYVGWKGANGQAGWEIAIVLVLYIILGLVFVLPTWALESFSYVYSKGRSREGRRAYLASVGIDSKPHLKLVAQWTGNSIYTDSGDFIDEGDLDGKNEFLLRNDIVTKHEPWTIAGACWILLSTTGFSWLFLGHFRCDVWMLALSATGALLALIFPWVLSRARRWAGIIPLALGALAATIGGIFGVIETNMAVDMRVLVAVSPWIPAVLLAFFYPLSYRESRMLIPNLKDGAKDVLAKMYGFVIG